MPSAIEIAIAFEALLIIWIGARSYRSYQGRRYSSGRVLIFPVLIVLLFLVTEAETISAVPWAFPTWTAVDGTVLVAASLATLPMAGRLVRVTRREDGDWYYQYGIELIGVYLGLWVLRLGLTLYFDPASIEVEVGAAPVALSATAAAVLVLIQGLFAVSSGLVIGRGIGTYRLYSRAQKRPIAPASPGQ